MNYLFISFLLLVSITCSIPLVRCQLTDESPTKKSLKPLHLRGGNLDIPGVADYSFVINDKTKVTKAITVQMSLNGTVLSLQTQIEYHKYVFVDESSSLMEYRYYKNCILNGLSSPYYTLTKTEAVIVFVDPIDVSMMYRFKLSKIEVTRDEMIELMFNAMRSEIAELKDRLWFSDVDMNKLGPRNLTSYDNNFQNFINSKTPTYTGKYTSIATNNYNNLVAFVTPDGRYISRISSYEAMQSYSGNSLQISFPIDIVFRKIEFEISNGGGCPYNSPIPYRVEIFYVKRETEYYVKNSVKALPIVERLSTIMITTKLSNGFTKYVLESPISVPTSKVFILISTNGFTSPGNVAFDGRCDYILQNMYLF